MIKTDLTYCPISWTAYYCNNGFGSDESKAELQGYINTLPKDKKFFTVVQYDDGIMVDFPNCLVFAAGGKPDNAIPIPLLCDPHKVEGEVEKDIPISLVANLNTHPIRKEIGNAMYGKDYCYIGKHGTEKYVEILRKSYFTICPRGYGKTSFRLYEAIQLGTIPIYVTDDPWLPYCDVSNGSAIYSYLYRTCFLKLDGFLETLYKLSQDIEWYAREMKQLKNIQRMFTYDYVADYIRRKITNG